MSYKILFSKQAIKDWQKIICTPLKNKTARLLEILEKDPEQPPYEKLVGDLEGLCSRRINLQHRLVYQVDFEEKTVYIVRMWSHYGDN